MAQRPKGVTPPPSPDTSVPAGRWTPPTTTTPSASTTTPDVTIPPTPVTPSTSVPAGRWTPPSTTTVPGTPAPGPTTAPFVPTNMQEAEYMRARNELARAQASALRAGVSPGKVESIVEQKEPNWGLKVLGKVINFDIIPGKYSFKPIEVGVIKPLQIWDTGRRFFVGGYGESMQALRNTQMFQDFLEKVPFSKQMVLLTNPLAASVLLSKPRVYESEDQIPIDEKTGLPKYKVGDVREEEQARFSDWGDVIMSPEKGFGDYVNTGNKWVDRAAGFTGDVILDPTTYLTLGVGTVTKEAAMEATEAGARAISKQVMKDIAKEAGTKAVALAEESARLQGQFLTKAEQQAIFKAEQAASMAAQEAAQAALTPAQQAVQQQLRRQAAIGPRRVLGAKSREALAQTAREIREYAGLVGNTRVANILSDEVIADIATRGYSAVKGSVAEALGTRGGIRFGAGTAKVVIPGTERIADTIGRTLTAFRVGAETPIKLNRLDNAFFRNAIDVVNGGFVNTPVGKALMKVVTPVGESGLFGSADILRMRTALRTGMHEGVKLTPAEGADFVRLLAEDSAYRGLKAAAVTETNQLLAPIYRDADFLKYSNTVGELLENPAVDLATVTSANASAILGRQVTDAELALAKRLQEVGDEFYNRANFLYQRAQLAAGTPDSKLLDLPKNPNWFPHTMSDKARRYLNANARLTRSMEKALDQLGVDRSFALAGSNLRQLKAGSEWFGYRLTQADINGGVRRLNELARRYGGLKFDFFETNAERAFTKYAAGWARDTSFTNYIYNMTLATEFIKRQGVAGLGAPQTYLGEAADVMGGGLFGGKAFGGELTQETAKLVTGVGMPTKLNALQNAINNVISPERIELLTNNAAARAEMTDIVQKMKSLSDEAYNKIQRGELLFRDEINSSLNDLEQRVLDLERLVPPGSFPGLNSALSSEASALLQSFRNEMDNITINLNTLDPQKWAQTVPIFLTGADQFLQLNRIKYPGVISSPEFQELITNYRRLEDPVFARGMNRALGGINRMFKGWVTATPGFHLRNALSNVFFMAIAGANPKNLIEGSKVFNAYRSFLKRISEEGLPAARVGEEYVTSTEFFRTQVLEEFFKSPEAAKVGIGPTSTGLRAELLDIFNSAPMTGYGQISDIFEGTGRLGVTGGVQTGTGVLPSTSRTLGKPLSWSRKAGSDIENWTRFALLWDGMKQGLSPEEAAIRTKKYLIDYTDLSRADQIARTIIPFWMWASRSLPLITESMWANPRAFQIWNSFTRNLEDKETGKMYLPKYLQAAIPIGGNFMFNPDFGYQKQEEGYGNLLDPSGLLGSLSPVIRAPFIEAPLNINLSKGGPLYNENYQDPFKAQTAYILQQLFPQAGYLGKLANVGIAGALAAGQIPGAPQGALEAIAAAPQTQVPEWAREFLGIGKPAYIQEQQGVMTPEEARQRAYSFFGLPFLELQPWQQQQVIEDIIKQLEAEKSRKRAEQGRR